MALIALLMLVGAGVLIQRVNARVEYSPQLSARTGDVLKQAKTALIARAVLDANRPGELPCPDVDYDGQVTLNTDFTGGANSPCASLLGWLPWRTLDLPDLRDASGARLWYALGDAWHAGNSTALNPDTAGGLTLNGAANPDIVAVILAPGADLKLDTDPRPAETSAAMNATTLALVQKFLEGANSDGTLTTYVNQAGGNFNDRLVIITRAELIAAVQRRVAGELAVALNNYRATNGRYPWLSDNTDPLATDPPLLNGVPAVRNGHIAYIDPSIPENYSFQSGLRVSWNKGSVSENKFKFMDQVIGTVEWYVSDDSKDAMENAVKDALNNASPQTVAMPVTATSGATCDWQNDTTRVDCDYLLATLAPYTVEICRKDAFSDVCPFEIRTVVRLMILNLHYQGAAATSTGSGARTRDVQSPASGPFQTSPSGNTQISFFDFVTGPTGFFAYRNLSFNDGDDADVNTTGIYAEPQSGGALPGDLPAWFAANNWGPYLYVSYAANFIPTGTGVCTVGTDCLNLSVTDNPARSDIEAVVMGSGVALGGQTRGAGSLLPNFFEEDNANGDDNVERKAGSTTFNDYLRLVACSPAATTPCQ